MGIGPSTIGLNWACGAGDIVIAMGVVIWKAGAAGKVGAADPGADGIIMAAGVMETFIDAPIDAGAGEVATGAVLAAGPPGNTS